MVIDLNKCLGCQTCTVACKRQWTSHPGQEAMWWNHVETVPGEGWPRRWPQLTPPAGVSPEAPGILPGLAATGGTWNFDVQRVALGNYVPARRLEPQVAETGMTPEWGPNWDEDQGGGVFPNSFFFYMPRLCNHCEQPACERACPRRAIRKRADGIVVVEEENCRGYRFCVEACPYKKLFFNPRRGITQKCIFCFPRVEQGEPPACVGQCPGRARFFGRLEDPQSPTHRLVRKFAVALPLHAEKKTQPNVFYVPPLSPPQYNANGTLSDVPRVPEALLVELFGGGVRDVLARLAREREKKAAGQASEVMDALINVTFDHAWTLSRS